MTPATPPPVTYAELARLFLRMSVTAFGGPVAHIAMIEEEVVNQRKWLSREHFLDLVAATNLIPGPNSTEVMIHIGYVMRGLPGAILTGTCFIAPSFLITVLIAALYVQGGEIPAVAGVLAALFWGIRPVIVAIIAQVGYRLAVTTFKDRLLWGLFAVGTVILLAFPQVPEVIVMLAAGLIYALVQTRTQVPITAFLLPLLPDLSRFAQAATTSAATLWDIFWYFLRIGSVLFGTGHVLASYIQQDVVSGFGWLNQQQFLDAFAMGQTTPGPVLTTVGAVGYMVAGLPGAILGTVGIFLPAFVLVIVTAPLIPRMRANRFLGAFLTGVNAGVIAAILVTLIDLLGGTFRTADGSQWSLIALVLGIGSLAVLIRYKLNSTWLIALGGLVGIAVSALGVML
jgi:chromate transporter